MQSITFSFQLDDVVNKNVIDCSINMDFQGNMVAKASTLQDVARVAGVSTATVSRTLSNPGVVSEQTRDVVAKAVKETGYRVNRAARNLRTQRAHSVLVLVPDLANPFFSKIMEGISQKLASHGYSMLIASTQQVQDSGDKLLDYLDDARADGLIILDGGLDADLVKDLESAQKSNHILFACEWIDDSSIPAVKCENAQGSRDAVNYLHSIGHSKIGHVTGPVGNVLMHTRHDAFVAQIKELGLALQPEWVIEGDFTFDAGVKAAKTWIAMDERPTAVFCASDQIALAFIAELSRRDFKVPQDVSVMGFDDIDFAEQFIPPLTTVKQNRTRLGEKAAELLMERIRSPEHTYTSLGAVLPVSLVVRASTAPF